MSRPLVLVPVDLGPMSEELVTYAAGLARGLGLRVGLFTVLVPVLDLAAEVPAATSGWLTEEMRLTALASAQRGLEALARRPPLEGLAVTREVAEGDAADAILDRAARPDVALVVMGTHGWGSLKRLLMGSVARRVLARSPRPVLVCRPDTTRAARDWLDLGDDVRA